MSRYLLAGAAFAALAAAPAFAQPAQGGPGGMMRNVETRAQLQQTIQQHFGELDANHDGFVTREEMDAAMNAAGGEGHRGMRGGNMFDRLDANRDGKLSLDELSTAFLSRFDRIDTNHDGTISPEEREAARAAARARMQERRGGGDQVGTPPAGEEPPQGN